MIHLPTQTKIPNDEAKQLSYAKERSLKLFPNFLPTLILHQLWGEIPLNWDFPFWSGDFIWRTILLWAIQIIMSVEEVQATVISAHIHVDFIMLLNFAWKVPPAVSTLLAPTFPFWERLPVPWTPIEQKPQTQNLVKEAGVSSGFLRENHCTASINIPIWLEITSQFSISHASEVRKNVIALMSTVFCLKRALSGRKDSRVGKSKDWSVHVSLWTTCHIETSFLCLLLCVVWMILCALVMPLWNLPALFFKIRKEDRASKIVHLDSAPAMSCTWPRFEPGSHCMEDSSVLWCLSPSLSFSLSLKKSSQPLWQQNVI